MTNQTTQTTQSAQTVQESTRKVPSFAPLTKRQRNYDATLRTVFTAMMAALSTILMMFSFKLPFLPSFLSVDFSDIPAMIAGMLAGPLSAVAVCLVKCIMNISTSMTAGVGELCSFFVSASLAGTAGLVTRMLSKKKFSAKNAVFGGISGIALAGIVCIPVNLFIVFPAFATAMKVDLDKILGMFQKILPFVDSILTGILIFNLPFTLAKGIIAVIITIPLYRLLLPAYNKAIRKF